MNQRTKDQNYAVARYNAGKTIRDIAAKLNRSYGYARSLLIEAGVPLREPGCRQRLVGRERTRLAKRLTQQWRNGASKVALAEKTGWSREFVRTLILECMAAEEGKK